MHWIYLINCENNVVYVGETKNLYSRLNQHVGKRGSKHTIQNKPTSLCGLYKVHSYYRFLKYCEECDKDEPSYEKIQELLDEFAMVEWNNKDWARYIEDFMTEIMMQYDDITTYGGKYVTENRDDLDTVFEMKELNRIPLCDCGFPAEIKISKTPRYYKLYFMCSMKNAWSSMREQYQRLMIEEPCGFYQEFMEYIENRIIVK